MEATTKILVTGGHGLVGGALRTELQAAGYRHIEAPTHSQCDFEDRAATMKLFSVLKPECVFHLAAKVGGIQANMKDPVGFLYANNLISGHVLEACHRFQVQKVVQLGSSCIYPKEAAQPMKEECLLTGPLENTNEGYALAKISAMKLAQYYHDEYGLQTACPIASNIYGPGDTFDLDRAHVLSALVRRFCDAHSQKKSSLQLWGTGIARRQFIHVKDVAQGLIFFMQQVNSPQPINLAVAQDVSIRELAEMIAQEVGFQGKIEWDSSKPDGMLKKCLDDTKLKALGFQPQISLRQGIRNVIEDYKRRSQPASLAK